jgi:hypothetical protein
VSSVSHYRTYCRVSSCTVSPISVSSLFPLKYIRRFSFSAAFSTGTSGPHKYTARSAPNYTPRFISEMCIKRRCSFNERTVLYPISINFLNVQSFSGLMYGISSAHQRQRVALSIGLKWRLKTETEAGLRIVVF